MVPAYLVCLLRLDESKVEKDTQIFGMIFFHLYT